MIIRLKKVNPLFFSQREKSLEKIFIEKLKRFLLVKRSEQLLLKTNSDLF